MQKRLRAGIIGSGFMSGVHAKAVRDSGYEVTAIASSSLESAERAARELGIAKAYASWQELVQSDLVDVVHVCTPNQLHAEITIAAAQAGKHVVCEKPISTSLDDALEMQRAVEANGVGFAVPFAYRFYPIVREIKARLAHGEAGDLHLIHGNYLQDWLADSGSSNWRVNSASGGSSRAFADVGTHWCDLMEFVTGDRISSLFAKTSKAYASRSGQSVKTEDIATVIFETESGVAGSLTVSQVSHGRKNQLLIELDGSLKSYTFNQELPDTLLIGGQASSEILNRGLESLRFEDARRMNRVPSGHPQGYQDAFNNFAADAYAAFEGKIVAGLPGISDGVRAATLIEAVLQSAETQTWVSVTGAKSELRTEMLAS